MAYENLLFEKRDQIALVTVNRPAVLNALNRRTVEELQDCFLKIHDDAQVRVTILTGAGEKSFVSGADINELARQTPLEGKEFSRFGQGVFNLIENLGKPVIAAVNGYALGGGCELAMACTMRLASENAKFGQPEVKLGIIAGYGGTQRLARLAGKGLAMQMLLTGEMVSAQDALRMGLVNQVTSLAELMPAAESMAKKIAANAPLAVKFTLEAVQHGMEMPQEEGLFLEATLFGLCCATEDMREGTKAFLEKRPAKFTSR
jgi:enoyl-CoA hydratase